ncbi:CoB--CoM heterodisulfide reductase iron-sulfur subunit A family protein [Natronobacterium gregoryi]|uniref:CoB--CoM heterodisulfide reductase iron-sulfur subunit A n=3 Tax=cellular organisms TaxID=131567 RepID=L0AJL3_NATGS|nr:CoB--CoM heterodisulfide reductase iron-sulfur subunit A family protein [Natronobacterium gregoryi]AFZ74001.1 polyferredoxin, heterodixulfide reductase subunit A [Natronobacterium gregoryi SP2]ELY70573.1 4Fe-4S ferredoxin [Natronobacterium gregoryi SP2]PLK20750.1 CoB--CoM heterodisulfide reductase iron-sulfur subunit A family protein [Natronobacterium gregoryi SP2]SFJ08051.1 heterodisulfide reductase subunit A [Natronobacterium gregoryi]
MISDLEVAVYLCESRGHVSDELELDAVVETISEHPNVTDVRTHELLCGPDGHDLLRSEIRENEPDRIVVGGGSLKDKRPGFETVLESAGMNPFLLQMVDLREQCSWVTDDPEATTEKACRLLRGGVERALHLEPLARETVAYDTGVLVYGESIAAIDAALQLAVADRQVYLVTEADSPGGLLVQKEFLYPKDQCAPCRAAPKLKELDQSDDVELIAPGQVTSVRGVAGNFEITIESEPRYVDSEACIPCDRCVDACPVSVPDEFEFELTDRAAIYEPFSGSIPGGYVIDEENCVRFDESPTDCTECADACPMDAVQYEETGTTREVTVGSAIVAPEAQPYDADRVHPTARDGQTDVYSNLEFERFFTESGPTNGAVELRDGTEPDSVAIVHCAGSRCEDHLSYCSGTCCLDALKLSRALLEAVPDCDVYQVFDDLVVPGREGEAYAQETFEMGATPVRWDLDHGDWIDLTVTDDGVTVAGTNRDGNPAELEVDAVVLAVGLEPGVVVDDLAETFDLERDERGFLTAEQPITSTAVARDGIYVAGPSAGPDGEHATLTQGISAVGEVLSRAVPGRDVELEPRRAVIDDELCTGCRICLETCPFDAIDRDDERGVAQLRDEVCQGCGACVSACPADAIDQRGFTTAQLEAEIDGVIEG